MVYINCRESFSYYNMYMGGVDRNDQLLSCEAKKQEVLYSRPSHIRNAHANSDYIIITWYPPFTLRMIEEEGLHLEQVYNCDETGLYHRMLSDKTLAARSEKEGPGLKKQKERITLMACSNATGTHKLPLLFIGKSAKPRCFKHMNMSALPVKYYAQRSAWMDTEIFTHWYHNEFVPAVKRHLKEKSLLLDNAPAHPEESVLTSSDKTIKTMFLPPNTTALIQPMDQGVLEALKR